MSDEKKKPTDLPSTNKTKDGDNEDYRESVLMAAAHAAAVIWQALIKSKSKRSE